MFSWSSITAVVIFLSCHWSCYIVFFSFSWTGFVIYSLNSAGQLVGLEKLERPCTICFGLTTFGVTWTWLMVPMMHHSAPYVTLFIWYKWQETPAAVSFQSWPFIPFQQSSRQNWNKIIRISKKLLRTPVIFAVWCVVLIKLFVFVLSRQYPTPTRRRALGSTKQKAANH